MSESLRNDGRVWVPKHPGDTREPKDIPESDRLYFLEEKYPSFGNLVPRDVASRNAKEQCDAGRGVGTTRCAVYLDFSDAIQRDGRETIEKKYGNLFEMYERITDESPYETPMRIYPASHYTMGGLWVDYNLMSTIPGLFVLGEANFSDHGANRLGASALMQGLADGYFIIPYTIGGYLAGQSLESVSIESTEFSEAEQLQREKIRALMSIQGKQTVDQFHRELGKIMWEYCGMSRHENGLQKALQLVGVLKQDFRKTLLIAGSDKDYNKALEKAGRMDDYLEFAELMIRDALQRAESCGCHFREEFQTEDGEAQRNDEEFCHVSVWEHAGEDTSPRLHKEPLVFENVELVQRSYK